MIVRDAVDLVLQQDCLAEEGDISSKAISSDVTIVDSAIEPNIQLRSKTVRRARQKKQPNTPLANDILDNLTRFPHCILLTRVGQFYESYFDQAVEVAQLLKIKLTSKSWGGQRIHMCGFPIMHLNKYLKVLVQQNKRFVALCEEFMRDRLAGAKGGFDRRVTRIVTPGTLIDEPFLNPYENNYLLSIATSETGGDATIGLAWIDISTGDFYTKTVSSEGIRDELVRINPREVVLHESLYDDPGHVIRQVVAEEDFFVSFTGAAKQMDTNGLVSMTSDIPNDDVASRDASSLPTDVGQTEDESAAVCLLTSFMHANLLEHMPQLTSPTREASTTRMQIDAHTLKALEIRENIREGGTSGSLLSVVKRTTTSSGTRLLARWLCSPSTSLVEIKARQTLVAFFLRRPHLRSDLIQCLRDTEDTTRIIQKFFSGRGDAVDLLALCNTIDVWSSIRTRIDLEREMELKEHGVTSDDEWSSINALLLRMFDVQELARQISLALVGRDDLVRSDISPSDPDTRISEPSSDPISFAAGSWTIKPEFSDNLKQLHETLGDLLSQRERLERKLQTHFDASSLTLRSSPGLGMHVHIGRGKRDASKIKADPAFVLISESNSTCSFFHQEWTQLGSEILNTTMAIGIAEKEAFEQLREKVNHHSNQLRRNARILDELDVTIGFASLADDMAFTRPDMREDDLIWNSPSYSVLNGRHPTVELGLLSSARVFTRNTVTFEPHAPLHIITGPNMAGKSTLLRQTALIAILAQTGSFVPADHAEIGIIDKVFSRIGAKDDLFHDKSTFMVEMLEAADILRRATPRSLVIMDEVGRGTTVDDGLAIAFATVHHLLTVNHCRTLFATHFHELADMLGYSPEHNHCGEGVFSKVQFFCTDVNETADGYFAYSYRLKPGVNRNSHGLKVARLAGMPQSTISVAENAMEWLRHRRENRLDDTIQLKTLGQHLATFQSSS
ncbi:muts domain V-domain-containing protein [Abortiporus biennis]|nr:muts domain V-domain-containing protein [Abortiporus biennis]